MSFAMTEIAIGIFILGYAHDMPFLFNISSGMLFGTALGRYIIYKMEQTYERKD